MLVPIVEDATLMLTDAVQCGVYCTAFPSSKILTGLEHIRDKKKSM